MMIRVILYIILLISGVLFGHQNAFGQEDNHIYAKGIVIDADTKAELDSVYVILSDLTNNTQDTVYVVDPYGNFAFKELESNHQYTLYATNLKYGSEIDTFNTTSNEEVKVFHFTLYFPVEDPTTKKTILENDLSDESLPKSTEQNTGKLINYPPNVSNTSEEAATVNITITPPSKKASSYTSTTKIKSNPQKQNTIAPTITTNQNKENIVKSTITADEANKVSDIVDDKKLDQLDKIKSKSKSKSKEEIKIVFKVKIGEFDHSIPRNSSFLEAIKREYQVIKTNKETYIYLVGKEHTYIDSARSYEIELRRMGYHNTEIVPYKEGRIIDLPIDVVIKQQR